MLLQRQRLTPVDTFLPGDRLARQPCYWQTWWRSADRVWLGKQCCEGASQWQELWWSLRAGAAAGCSAPTAPRAAAAPFWAASASA